MKLERILVLAAFGISIVAACFAAFAHSSTTQPSESITTHRVVVESPAATARSVSIGPDKLVFNYTLQDGTPRTLFLMAEDIERWQGQEE